MLRYYLNCDSQFQKIIIGEQNSYMHDIEPYFKWKEYYIASEDKQSPFYKRQYNEFQFTQKIYNFYIHPQWDEFGSQTLYCKILFTDYEERYTLIELIGEWNDSLYNDIMFFKRNVINKLIDKGINQFILLCDNVLNYHGDDNSYYEEWFDDIEHDHGFICCVNTFKHVRQEMERTQIQYYVQIGHTFEDVEWRRKMPAQVLEEIIYLQSKSIKQLDY